MPSKPTDELVHQKASKIAEKTTRNPEIKAAKSNKKLKEEEKKLSKLKIGKLKMHNVCVDAALALTTCVTLASLFYGFTVLWNHLNHLPFIFCV